MKHIVAKGEATQSEPYWLDGVVVCDLEFEEVKITVPFFIGLRPPVEVLYKHWPKLVEGRA